MNCVEIRQSVQDYVTRQLDPEGRRLFDAHLVECAACQRELSLMTAVVSTLDHQPVLEPSSGFRGKVLASLPRQRRFAPSPWWSLALAPLLAGVVWFCRAPLGREMAGLLGRLTPGRVALPVLTAQNAGIVAAAVAGLGLLVAAGGVVFCWQAYIRD